MGFINCQNKTKGVMGCKCHNMNEAWMHYKAVAMMRAFALTPGFITNHTGDNSVGLLSWAGPSGGTYSGQQTQYTTPDLDVFSHSDGGDEALALVYKRLLIKDKPSKSALIAFRQQAVKFGMSKDMSVLCMIVKQDLEYSFFTPVKTADIKFGGIDEGGIKPPEDPVEKVARLRNLKKGTTAYNDMVEIVQGKKDRQASAFIKIAAQATPVIFHRVPLDVELPIGFRPREPQLYHGLGVGRKEDIGR